MWGDAKRNSCVGRVSETTCIPEAGEGPKLVRYAKQCGISKSTLDGYLKGVSPTLKNIVKLCDGLGISLNLLVAELGTTGVTPDVRAVEASAYDELSGIFQAAVSNPKVNIIDVVGETIGGRQPNELARSLASFIADNYSGLRKVSSDTGDGDDTLLVK